MKVSLRAWMAGFFDGEGCISVARGYASKNNPTLKISVGNTRDESLLIFQDGFGGTVRARKVRPNHLQSYVWRCPHATQKDFLLTIIPYLVIKRTRAELALDFLTTRGKKLFQRGFTYRMPIEFRMKRLDIAEKITNMNHGGKI